MYLAPTTSHPLQLPQSRVVVTFACVSELEMLVYVMVVETDLTRMLSHLTIYVSNVKNGATLHHLCQIYQTVGLEMHIIMLFLLV